MSESGKKIDSNLTGLAYAEEAALGILPSGAVGSQSLGSFTAATTTSSVDSIDLVWDDVSKELTITGNMLAGQQLAYCRVNSDLQGNDVGIQVEIYADTGVLITGDPVGGIGRWDSSPAALTSDAEIVVVVSIPGAVVGEVLTIEFDGALDFADDDSRTITLDVLGSGIAVWRELEPNSYSDFGGEITNVSRNPINKSRQRRKGVVTDLDANGGFNHDITQQNSLIRLMQGFFFAAAHEKVSTNPFRGTGPSAITPVMVSIGATGVVTFASTGQAAEFKAGDRVFLSGFANTGNNGPARVTSVSSATVILFNHGSFVAETIAAKMEVCGFRSVADECDLTVLGNTVVLSFGTTVPTTLKLQVGEWIFLGGDSALTAYANNIGYARVKAVTSTTIVLVNPTWANPIVEDCPSGGVIELYFGTFMRNENDPDLIVCQSYQLERSLGKAEGGTQAEYLVGSIANVFTLNVPTADKLNADLEFIAITNETQPGNIGLKAGTRVAPGDEEGYNTSSDIYTMRMYVHDSLDVTPGALFAYIQEGSLGITNNASATKAIGVLGGFDVNVGTFEVGGEVTAYFQNVDVIEAVRVNSDVGMYIISARENEGFVYDLPLLSLGGGRLNVEQDQPIMVPVESMGAKNEDDYTLSASYFPYLPNLAMA